MTATRTPAAETTCEVCERTTTRRHPCRFEKACACWYGVPCEPAGATYHAMQRATKRAERIEQ